MAAESRHLVLSPKGIGQIQIPDTRQQQPAYCNCCPKSLCLLPSPCRTFHIKASSTSSSGTSNPKNKDTHTPLLHQQATRRKKSPRRTPRRRLITISTGGATWHGKWTCDYILTLRDLQLQDLVDEDHGCSHKNADVSINLCVQKHAGFGFSVEGRIITSLTRKCCYCNSPFCSEIDTTFNVWILPSRRDNHSPQFPEIGDDPSVIYVKPGHEADLDSLVRDTVRLTTSVNESCSESCKKSESVLSYCAGEQTGPATDGRWSRLQELRKAYS